ncbi:hypothetical protein [Luteimonas aquatica]|uniref:hypothetical protein n=1 Tax=Luteimonas aquatica TaxID=450364 RepID=UPI001F5AB0DB|nr:hypothetical protein [Luteimonas aquatica]
MRKAKAISRDHASDVSGRQANEKLNRLIGQIQKQMPKAAGLDAQGAAAATSCRTRIYCV